MLKMFTNVDHLDDFVLSGQRHFDRSHDILNVSKNGEFAFRTLCLRGSKQVRYSPVYSRVGDVATFDLIRDIIVAAECFNAARTLGEERHNCVVLEENNSCIMIIRPCNL